MTNCHGLKMTAADGKKRVTDVSNVQQIFRLIQSIPSPKAEPFKQWLAKVGAERIQKKEEPLSQLFSPLWPAILIDRLNVNSDPTEYTAQPQLPAPLL